MQLPNSRIGKEDITCYTPVFVEEDAEFRCRSKAYLVICSLLTSCVLIAWMQAWVSQPKHAQLLQVALMMTNESNHTCMHQSFSSDIWRNYRLLYQFIWSIYFHPWLGQSGRQVDTKLILHCPKPSGHHTALSPHVTLFLYVIFLVFATSIQNAMPMGLGDGSGNKAKRVSPCA